MDTRKEINPASEHSHIGTSYIYVFIDVFILKKGEQLFNVKLLISIAFKLVGSEESCDLRFILV